MSNIWRKYSVQLQASGCTLRDVSEWLEASVQSSAPVRKFMPLIVEASPLTLEDEQHITSVTNLQTLGVHDQIQSLVHFTLQFKL